MLCILLFNRKVEKECQKGINKGKSWKKKASLVGKGNGAQRNPRQSLALSKPKEGKKAAK